MRFLSTAEHVGNNIVSFTIGHLFEVDENFFFRTVVLEMNSSIWNLVMVDDSWQKSCYPYSTGAFKQQSVSLVFQTNTMVPQWFRPSPSSYTGHKFWHIVCHKYSNGINKGFRLIIHTTVDFVFILQHSMWFSKRAKNTQPWELHGYTR